MYQVNNVPVLYCLLKMALRQTISLAILQLEELPLTLRTEFFLYRKKVKQFIPTRKE